MGYSNMKYHLLKKNPPFPIEKLKEIVESKEVNGRKVLYLHSKDTPIYILTFDNPEKSFIEMFNTVLWHYCDKSLGHDIKTQLGI